MSDDPRSSVGQYHPSQSGVVLVDPEQVTVEVAISPITRRLLLRVTARTAAPDIGPGLQSGTTEQEQFWAEGVRELVVDLGREFLLVLRPDQPPERRKREE